MFGPTVDDAVFDLQAGHAVEEAEIHVLAERKHERVGFQRLELSGRLRESRLVQPIFSTVSETRPRA
jgi:hypothetical protein